MKTFTTACQEFVNEVLFDSFGAKYHYHLLSSHPAVLVNSHLKTFGYYARFLADHTEYNYDFVANTLHHNQLELQVSGTYLSLEFHVFFENGCPISLIYGPVVVATRNSSEIISYITRAILQRIP